MRERGILFSGPMVRALLDGRKTQTRRIVKGVPVDTESIRWVEEMETLPKGAGYTGWVVQCGAPLLLPRKCPYGVPGDRLWVRETLTRSGGFVQYAADNHTTSHIWPADWKQDPRPSIHMPRWASRLTLELTGVRVERVQDISEDDAIAEGCVLGHHSGSHREEFAEFVWDSLNAKRAPWASNPWVWVMEFGRALGAGRGA